MENLVAIALSFHRVDEDGDAIQEASDHDDDTDDDADYRTPTKKNSVVFESLGEELFMSDVPHVCFAQKTMRYLVVHNKNRKQFGVRKQWLENKDIDSIRAQKNRAEHFAKTGDVLPLPEDK